MPVRRPAAFNKKNPMHPTLMVAIEAARAAANVIRDAAADPAALQIKQKNPNDFVTQIDLASERTIVGMLLSAFPHHSVRAEESEQAYGTQGAEQEWIVDPLDGTNNFIHGYPAYSVSIALAVAGRIEHAVVMDVSRGDVYHASRGSGAFCNDQPIHVSPRSIFQEAMVATSCPARPGPTFARAMQMLGDVMLHTGAIRRSGSAALDLAHVAAGYCEGCFDLGLRAWDVAGGSLLVTEAGGCVGDFLGGDQFLEMQECMAGNPATFAGLGAVLRPYSRLANQAAGRAT